MEIRNIAIIAHVDHGKTTLVDKMLRQAGAFRENQVVMERVMDSNPLERERGITILAKNTSVRWKGTKINIVDTPGHADFGGEVERILRMVDGVLLVVDAFDGPMPQTRFVLRKALALGRTPIIVINKIDRPGADPMRVHDEVLDLFIELEANEAQLDAPYVYASGRLGTSTMDMEDEAKDLTPLFETIMEHVPAPPHDAAGPFQMLVSTIDYSPYLGRLAIGRIERGTVHVGDTVSLLPLDHAARRRPRARSPSCTRSRGSSARKSRAPRPARSSRWPGLEGVEIGLTLTDPEHPERLEGIAVEEPTISVDFLVNNSPFAGQGRQVRDVAADSRATAQGTREERRAARGRDRLDRYVDRERARRAASLDPDGDDAARGYEFQVSRPRVITHRGPNGERLEPYEELAIDVPEEFMGVVMEKLGPRKAEMIEMKNPGQGLVRLLYKIPARGLFGYRSASS